MMLKRYTILFCALTSFAVVQAQTSSSALDEYKLSELVLQSSNTALLQNISFKDLGETALQYQHTSGRYKHPLLAKNINAMAFQSERYQAYKGWKLYGQFGINLNKESDVANTTQLNPLRLNPYIIVDSLSGDWNKQHYTIDTKIASPIVWDKVGFGLGLKYTVQTGARQRDPRPQNTNNDLQLSPSIRYQLDEHHALGIQGEYKHFVEDFSVENINTTTVHNLYKMIGLGEYVGSSPMFISTGGINRRYSGNLYGGGLSYYFAKDHKKLLVEPFFHKNKERAIDGSIYPQEAGLHAYTGYGVNVIASVKSIDKLHKVSFLWNQKDIDNTEYHQNQDPVTKQYNTIFKQVFNTNLISHSNLNYQLGSYNSDGLLSSVNTLGITYQGADNRYSGNQSRQTIDRLTYNAGYSNYCYFKNSSGLVVKINLGFSHVISSALQYDEKSYATNFVAHSILYPTNAYLASNYWSGDLSLQYNFKRISSTSTQFYVKAGAGSVSIAKDNDYFNKDMSRFSGQVAIGLLTF